MDIPWMQLREVSSQGFWDGFHVLPIFGKYKPGTPYELMGSSWGVGHKLDGMS